MFFRTPSHQYCEKQNETNLIPQLFTPPRLQIQVASKLVKLVIFRNNLRKHLHNCKSNNFSNLGITKHQKCIFDNLL